MPPKKVLFYSHLILTGLYSLLNFLGICMLCSPLLTVFIVIEFSILWVWAWATVQNFYLQFLFALGTFSIMPVFLISSFLYYSPSPQYPIIVYYNDYKVAPNMQHRLEYSEHWDDIRYNTYQKIYRIGNILEWKVTVYNPDTKEYTYEKNYNNK